MGGAGGCIGGVPSGDYHGEFCAAGGTSNRSTELDWTRFFWDVTTKSSMQFRHVLETVVAADPHDWNPTDAGSSGDFPAERMEAAFTSEGWGSAWSSHAPWNGVED